MEEKTVFGTVLILLLVGMATPAFSIQQTFMKSAGFVGEDSDFGGVSENSGNGDWPMFHYDERNRGYSSFETTSEVVTSPHLIWSYDLPGTVYGSPVVADVDGDGSKEIFIDNGIVGVGGSGGCLYCINESGQLIWTFQGYIDPQYGLWAYSTPAIGDIDQNGFDEILYWSKSHLWYDYMHDLHCLEPTGTVRWQYPIRGNFMVCPAAADHGMPTIANITGGQQLEIVVQYAGNEELYCFNYAGACVWAYSYSWIAGPFDREDLHVAPAVADINEDGHGETVISMIYWSYTTPPSEGAVFCVSSTGSLLWSRRDIVPGYWGTAENIGSSPVIEDLEGDGSQEILVGSNNATKMGVWCLNQTGGTVWFYPLTSYIHDTIAVADIDNDGAKEIVFGADDNYIYCLSSTGSLRWKYLTGDKIWSSAAIADIEKPLGGQPKQLEIVVGSLDGKLYCLNSTGKLLWTYNAGAPIYSSPTIVDLYSDEGTPDIIFAASNKLYALRITPAHDLAVTNVSPYKITVGQEGKLKIDVTVKNKGDFSESFNVTVYGNTTEIQTKTVALDPYLTTVITFERNTTEIPLGNYIIKAVAGPVSGEYHTIDNTFVDGTVTMSHDIAVTNVSPHRTTVGQGYYLPIYTTVKNEGDYLETFNVTLYVDETEIQAETVTLNPYTSTILTFEWNTTESHLGSYEIKAIADVVPEEYDTIDNTFVDGTVIIQSPVHDVAVIGIRLSEVLVIRGTNTEISVEVENQGNSNETFNITLYANEIEIQTKEVANIHCQTTQWVDFTWNTTEFPGGEYRISASASIVPSESQTEDNTFIDGLVQVYDTYVHVYPDVTWVQPNQIFTIQIRVTYVIDLYMWFVDLHFDPTILTWISGGSLYLGYVHYEGIRYPPVTGNYTLLTVKFEGKTEGISPLHLSNVLLYDFDANSISFFTIDGVAKVVQHEIAVTKVTPDRIVAARGYAIEINATIENKGFLTETLNVTVYANRTIIETKEVTLTSGNSATITFTWNTTGFAKGNYTISAYAWPVPGETDTEDNNCTDGWILVTRASDLGSGPPPTFFKCDGEVDAWDLALFIVCYNGIAPPEAMYLADIGTGPPPTFFAPDGIVDAWDLALFLLCYNDLGPDP